MTVPSGYTHLSKHQRLWLSMLIKDGCNCREIGRRLERHHTTISREIKRNSLKHYRKRIYDPTIAEQKYNERIRRSRGSKIRNDKYLERIIESMLQISWSPDVIAGFLKRADSSKYVSHETIYQYIYREKREWIPLLAYGHKRRRKRAGKYQNRKKVLIPGRVLIDKRPKRVDSRSEFGHFEADTFVSRKSKEAGLITIERKSRKIRLRKLNRKTAECVKTAMIGALYAKRAKVKSITYDNGTENVFHQEINKALQCVSFFCNPYHSWERGSVEQCIGLVRRFIPKGSDLSLISETELRKIERIINNRPRKILNYKTPNEVYSEEWCTSD